MVITIRVLLVMLITIGVLFRDGDYDKRVVGDGDYDKNVVVMVITISSTIW